MILISPTQNDAGRGRQKFPDLTLAELNQGKIFFENNCNKCHGEKISFKVSEKHLYKVVPRMAKKKAKVDDKTEALILKYLVTMHSAQRGK